MSANANADHACVDCGARDVAMILRTAIVLGRRCSWHECSRCHFKVGGSQPVRHAVPVQRPAPAAIAHRDIKPDNDRQGELLA